MDKNHSSARYARPVTHEAEWSAEDAARALVDAVLPFEQLREAAARLEDGQAAADGQEGSQPLT